MESPCDGVFEVKISYGNRIRVTKSKRTRNSCSPWADAGQMHEGFGVL
jgi:hypothetical protein